MGREQPIFGYIQVLEERPANPRVTISHGSERPGNTRAHGRAPVPDHQVKSWTEPVYVYRIGKNQLVNGNSGCPPRGIDAVRVDIATVVGPATARALQPSLPLGIFVFRCEPGEHLHGIFRKWFLYASEHICYRLAARTA